eukprot:Skav225218  [mRNA]  locus=scaffold4555:30015:32217:- [translate_table: standard]
MMSVRESQAQKDEEVPGARDARGAVPQGLAKPWAGGSRSGRRWLRGVFAAADKDGSMTLERAEYRELLKLGKPRERGGR